MPEAITEVLRTFTRLEFLYFRYITKKRDFLLWEFAQGGDILEGSHLTVESRSQNRRDDFLGFVLRCVTFAMIVVFHC